MTTNADVGERGAGKPAAKLSTDTWAVGLALVLAVLVGLGIIGKVPW